MSATLHGTSTETSTSAQTVFVCPQSDCKLPIRNTLLSSNPDPSQFFRVCPHDDLSKGVIPVSLESQSANLKSHPQLASSTGTQLSDSSSTDPSNVPHLSLANLYSQWTHEERVKFLCSNAEDFFESPIKEYLLIVQTGHDYIQDEEASDFIHDIVFYYGSELDDSASTSSDPTVNGIVITSKCPSTIRELVLSTVLKMLFTDYRVINENAINFFRDSHFANAPTASTPSADKVPQEAPIAPKPDDGLRVGI